ncbi:MAG: tyrosine-type recombinase/integrase [Candidatus Thorarchaeota archaeon]
MPRKPVFKKTLDIYLENCRNRGLVEESVKLYDYLLTMAYEILNENDLNTHPSKIGEAEIGHLLRNDWKGKFHYFRVLNAFLRRNKNFIMQEMDLRFPKLTPKRTWLSDADAEVVLARCDRPIEKIVVSLMLLYGMRRSETTRAMREDFNGNLILIRGKGRFGLKPRYLPKVGLLGSILHEWDTERDLMMLEASSELPNLLIYLKAGRIRPYTPNAIGNMIWNLSKKLDLRFSCHTLRRTFARAMRKEKAELEDIAETLGHDSIDQTLEYIGIEYEGMVVPMVKVQNRFLKTKLRPILDNL